MFSARLVTNIKTVILIFNSLKIFNKRGSYFVLIYRDKKYLKNKNFKKNNVSFESIFIFLFFKIKVAPIG